jgi:lipopolysaccharide export system protein LptA
MALKFMRFVLLAWGLSVSALSHTQPADPVDVTVPGAEEASDMNVRADDFEFDLPSREATYKGKVIVNQGDFRLNADEVRVFLNEENQFIRLEAYGKPARLRDGSDAQMIQLFGQTLVYEPPVGRVIAEGNPRLNRDTDKLRANTIEYNTKTGKAIALGNKRRQVRIQLLPPPQSGAR